MLSAHAAMAGEGGKVRPAVCAGTWYPGDATALGRQVDELLARSVRPALPSRPLALICPHAGYQFSAPVVATAYACVAGGPWKRVIALAFSHRDASSYRGIDVPQSLTAYATPLGEVPLDRPACDRLLAQPPFKSLPAVGSQEHSLELQLPFLQRALRDFRLVPLLLGELSETDITRAARALLPLLDAGTLLVASSDFTHYGPRFGYCPFTANAEARLRELADQAAAPLLQGDYDGFVAHLGQTGDTICGHGPIQLLLRTLSMGGGAQAIRTGCESSGSLTGDWTDCVTYQAFVFTRPPGTLDSDERAALLHIARQTVTAHILRESLPPVDPAPLSARLRTEGACFVTLHCDGELRGCIGNMLPEVPLYQAVMRNAVCACQDPRFVDQPLTPRELDRLDLEISYLTPLVRIASIDEIVIGRHGLMICAGPRRGVLLPQVAYERGWTRAEFLTQVCHKAGLAAEAWQQPETELYRFEAEVFGSSAAPHP